MNGTFKELIEHLCESPISQADTYIVESCKEILKKDPTEGECYDHLVWVSRRPCPQDISSFVRAMCEVDRYYVRPPHADHTKKMEMEFNSQRKK